jgi:hypothetical protein
LDGRRTTYERSIDVREPFDLIVPNTLERLADAPDGALFFGGYDWDGSLVYLDQSERVVRCDRDTAEPLNTWPDLSTMLWTEFVRLESRFDIDSGALDFDSRTTPD